MKKALFLIITLTLSIPLLAQLEVREGSFKEVAGFVNINTEIMYDDNDQAYSVLKIKTENINDKERRQLVFEGDARTFFELEYKPGEVWLYISYYASFLKISHPDFGSTEFWFPYDMVGKKGYELTLTYKPFVDEEIINRLEKLEGVYSANMNQNYQPYEQYDNTPSKSLNGRFSVSKKQQVVFSQGNLQYCASVDIWRFAENQWDYIGEENKMASRKYKGWIDLFGYGTSGYDERLQPYTTKANTDVMDDDIERTNYDWGVYNEISNGGKQRDIWRTLTRRECDFLFNKRKTKSGLLYTKAKVNGINGIILFPDNWDNSTYSFEIDKYGRNSNNKRWAKYDQTIIDKSTWVDVFESNGAVFLPAAGCRNGSGNRIGAVGEDGCYWSSTDAKGEEDAHNLFFDYNSLNTNDKTITTEGLSVRLVQDCKD